MKISSTPFVMGQYKNGKLVQAKDNTGKSVEESFDNHLVKKVSPAQPVENHSVELMPWVKAWSDSKHFDKKI